MKRKELILLDTYADLSSTTDFFSKEVAAILEAINDEFGDNESLLIEKSNTFSNQIQYMLSEYLSWVDKKINSIVIDYPNSEDIHHLLYVIQKNNISIRATKIHVDYKIDIEKIKSKILPKIKRNRYLIDKLWTLERKKLDTSPKRKQNIQSKICFLIHGRNEDIKYSVRNFIKSKFKLKVIILHEQVNHGKTIIEKFETFSDVLLAISLWTDDDLGKCQQDKKLTPRARQNVVFETGFFIGKLGREKTIVLCNTNIEIPSDLSGLIYIPLDKNWQTELGKEIRNILKNNRQQGYLRNKG